MFALLIIGCALLGLIVGSFLNVVIYRVPRNESIVSPPSACPRCATPIAVRDNVPVLSWLALRGKCRQCHAPIDVRYPVVELVTALLFAGVAVRFGFSWAIPVFLIFFAGLFALSWIDVEHLVLPKRVVYVQLSLVTAALLGDAIATHQWHRLIVALACSLVWFALFFFLNFIDPHWLGFGDVRLALTLGLALGWLGVADAILGFFAANLIGAAVGIALIAAGKIERSRRIPYGVFLTFGAAVAVFAGPALLTPFHLSS